MKRTASLGAFLVLVTTTLACQTSSAVQKSEQIDGPAQAHPSSVVDGRRWEVDEAVVADPKMAAYLERFAEDVRARAARVVGHLATPLNRRRNDSGFSAAGTFAADAMLRGISRTVGDVDVCFTNAGGLRIDIPPGSVTAGQIIEFMPFDNTVVVFEMTGQSLEALLLRIHKRGDHPAGVRYGQENSLVVSGRPLEHEGHYRVCTNDYIFEGGGAYRFDDATHVNFTGVLLRDLFISEFELSSSKELPLQVFDDGRMPR